MLSGGLQPFVIPASVRAAMSAWNVWVAVSANVDVPASKLSARLRNAAICPRVTRSSEQKRVLSGGLQPFVMPASAKATM